MPSRASRTRTPRAVGASGEDAPDAQAAQRLDKWLWYARIVKTRTLAAELVTTGKVRVNRTKTDKPSTNLKVDDVVTLTVRGRVRVLKVCAPGTRRGPASEAQTLYEDLTAPREPTAQEAHTGEQTTAPAQAEAAVREPGSGRPTKRDRRLTDRLRNEQ